LSLEPVIGTRGGVPGFRAVLDAERFPLRRWQILAVADDYGVDARTRTKLEQIPDRAYVDGGDVMIALAMTPAHLAARTPL
jgi:hypothetical protein